MGTWGRNISGEQFSGSLTAAAPGTFEAGGPYNPTISLTENTGDQVRRWVLPPTAAVGSLTLTFLSRDAAIGYFSFAGLLPDSATIAAGTTTRRNVTAGTFTVNLSR